MISDSARHYISKSELPFSAFCEYQLFIEVQSSKGQSPKVTINVIF